MKNITILLAAAACILFGVSCSTTDLGGSVPLPFTSPPVAAALELEFRPLPPKFCVGLDIEPAASEDTAED